MTQRQGVLTFGRGPATTTGAVSSGLAQAMAIMARSNLGSVKYDPHRPRDARVDPSGGRTRLEAAGFRVALPAGTLVARAATRGPDLPGQGAVTFTRFTRSKLP